MHPSVESPARERQRRLIGVLLAAPFIAGPVMAVSHAHHGPAVSLALLCGSVALCWALALVVTLTGRSGLVERAALAAGPACVALASAGGGLPVLLLAAAIGFEAWWVDRSRGGIVAGIVAALAAFPLAELALRVLGPASVHADAWLWLAPAVLALSVPARLRAAMGGEAETAPAIDPMVERMAIPVIRLTAAGEIAAASTAGASALGLGREALLGRPFLDRVHIADRVAFLTALGERDGEPRALDVRLRVAMAGRPGDRFEDFSVTVTADADGALLSLRADDSAALRERLEGAMADVESLDIAKGRFLAAVSHELRTPLNSIIGFSDMLLHGMAGRLEDPRQEDYVGLIRESGGHLLSVVNAILDVSRIESGAYGIRPEPFAVRDAVDLCHAMLTPQAEEKGLTFIVRTRADVGEILADRRAVQQIVINLAANAIKFTERGGKVSVEASRNGPWLRIVVSDTGIGMSEDELERVGRPFVQVRNDLSRPHEGTGLGLSLVKGLVRLHDGEMTIESAPGEGTLVTVALPVAGPVAGPRAGRGEAKNAADGGADEPFRKIA